MRIRIAQGLLGLLGALVVLRGVDLLWTTIKHGQLLEIGIWLAAGIVLHDGLIAPVTLLLGKVLHPVTALRAAWLAAGSVVLLAIPLFGGARVRQNPTVVPGHPLPDLLTALALVAAGAVLSLGVRALLRRRSSRPSHSSRST